MLRYGGGERSRDRDHVLFALPARWPLTPHEEKMDILARL